MKDAFNYYYDLAFSTSDNDKVTITIVFAITMAIWFILTLIKEMWVSRSRK